MTLALIDYQAGNLHSVENALRAAGCADLTVTADPEVVRKAGRVIFPGVGHAGASMQVLAERGLDDATRVAPAFPQD